MPPRRVSPAQRPTMPFLAHSSASSLSPAPSLHRPASTPMHPYRRALHHSLHPLFLLVLALLATLFPSFTAAQPQYASTPYTAPTCLNASFLLASRLSLPPSGPNIRPTVTLERDGWAGHYLTTSLAAQVLRDALGYSVAIVDVNSTQGQLSDVFARLAGAAGHTHTQMNFEVWPRTVQQADYAQYVAEEESVVSAGPLGLVQQSGWYVPTSLVNLDWIDFYDFWKGYRYDRNLTAVFPAAGSTPDAAKQGNGREFVPSWCVLETEPAGCSASYYNEAYLQRQCNVSVYSPYCIEMYAIDALLYDSGVLQQQITNLALNITLVFLGEANYNATMSAAIASNRSFLSYSWTPAPATSTQALTRVALPSYTQQCWSSYGVAGSLQGNGSLACDFPPLSVSKYFSASLSNESNVDSYRDAIYLLEAINFANQHQQAMLAQMADVAPSGWQAFADGATCDWLQSHVSLWKGWISLSPQQYHKDIPRGAWIVVVVLVSALCAYSLLLHGFVYYYRQHPLLLSSSPFFGQVIIGGSWFLYVAIASMRWKYLEAVCSVIPTFLCIAYTLVIGTLFAKTWRLNRIFKGASLKSVRVSAWDVVLFISLLFTIDFIIVAAWLIIDRPVPVWEVDSTNSLQLITVCYSAYWNVWYALLIVPKAIQVLYGTYLAYNVRHINANFNESRYIGLAILHLVVFAVIVIPLDRALEKQLTVHYLLVTLMLCLGVFVTLSLVFLPKAYAIIYKRKGQPHKRVLRAVEDSKSEAAGGGPNDPNSPAGAAAYRWMRERVMADVSDSDKLSFPSLHGGGFVHAVRIVRLVAEQLYRECGIAEYWQFCVAVRNMSQQELEARAPLLVAYLQQHVTLQQQHQHPHAHHHPHAHPHHHHPAAHDAQLAAATADQQQLEQQQQQQQKAEDEQKELASDAAPLSQDLSTLADADADDRPIIDTATPTVSVKHVVVEIPSDVRRPASRVEYADHPITQQSFSFAPSQLAVSQYQSKSSSAGGVSGVMSRQSVLAEDSCTVVSLPPLPAGAWTMTDEEINQLTLPGLPSPLSSPSFPAASSPQRSSSTSTLIPISPSYVSSPSSPHHSFPLASPAPLSQSAGGQSFASQLSFSSSQPPHRASHPSQSHHPSGSNELSVPFSSTHSPTSPANHHSTTDSGSGASDRVSGLDSEVLAARSKAVGPGPKAGGAAAGAVRAMGASDGETHAQ